MAILSYDQHFPAFPSFADENNWRCALMLLWLFWTWNASKKWIWSPLKMLLENADNVFLQAYRWKKHREIIGTRPFYNLVPIASLFFFIWIFCWNSKARTWPEGSSNDMTSWTFSTLVGPQKSRCREIWLWSGTAKPTTEIPNFWRDYSTNKT